MKWIGVTASHERLLFSKQCFIIYSILPCPRMRCNWKPVFDSSCEHKLRTFHCELSCSWFFWTMLMIVCGVGGGLGWVLMNHASMTVNRASVQQCVTDLLILFFFFLPPEQRSAGRSPRLPVFFLSHCRKKKCDCFNVEIVILPRDSRLSDLQILLTQCVFPGGWLITMWRPGARGTSPSCPRSSTSPV